MSNIDKRAFAMTKELATLMVERFSMNPVSSKLLNEAWQKEFPDEAAIAKRMLSLLDELEAAELRKTELTEALRQSVIGYKFCLRMGYDRILDLGGDCDSPEVMIAGNPDIQLAEKLLAAAAGKGV